MDKDQSARLTMNHIVLRFLDDNAQLVKKLPAFELLVRKLKTNVKEIEKLEKQAGRNDEKSVAAKEKLRKQLADETIALCTPLNAFATDSGLVELKKEITSNMPKLQQMAAYDLLAFGRIIRVMLSLHGTALKTYAVTPGMIQRFRKKLSQLVAESGANKVGGKNTINPAERLRELMKENTRLFDKKIKPLAKAYLHVYPVFFNKLSASFHVPNRYFSLTSASGVIRDKKTGYTLAGVNVKANGTDFRVTSKRIGYRLRLPENGVYTLEFEKPGYVPVVLKDVKIKPGENVTIDILLQAIA